MSNTINHQCRIHRKGAYIMSILQQLTEFQQLFNQGADILNETQKHIQEHTSYRQRQMMYQSVLCQEGAFSKAIDTFVGLLTDSIFQEDASDLFRLTYFASEFVTAAVHKGMSPRSHNWQVTSKKQWICLEQEGVILAKIQVVYHLEERKIRLLFEDQVFCSIMLHSNIVLIHEEFFYQSVQLESMHEYLSLLMIFIERLNTGYQLLDYTVHLGVLNHDDQAITKRSMLSIEEDLNALLLALYDGDLPILMQEDHHHYYVCLEQGTLYIQINHQEDQRAIFELTFHSDDKLSFFDLLLTYPTLRQWFFMYETPPLPVGDESVNEV